MFCVEDRFCKSMPVPPQTHNRPSQRKQNWLKNVIRKASLAFHSQQASDGLMPASHFPLLAFLRVMSLLSGQLWEGQEDCSGRGREPALAFMGTLKTKWKPHLEWLSLKCRILLQNLACLPLTFRRTASRANIPFRKRQDQKA